MTIATEPGRRWTLLEKLDEARQQLRGHWLQIGNAVSILGLVGLGLYFFFFEPPWLTYVGTPFMVKNSTEGHALPQVHRGTIARLQVGRCNSDTRPRLYAIGRRLVCNGEQSLILKATEAAIEPGCHNEESRVNEIPSDAALGVCRIVGYAEVAGAVRVTLATWESQPFEVVP